MKKLALIAVSLAAVLAVGSYLALPYLPQWMTRSSESLRALTPQIPIGDNVRIEVELPGAPAGAIAVTTARLDMGPDGMEAMTAPLRAAQSSRPGTLAFETDILMAGRWSLSLTANVEGRSQPISGRIVLTAMENAGAATAALATKKNDREILYYRNPMGLPDVSPTPKKDSMGMDYIAVYAGDASGADGSITLSPEKIQRTGVRTQAVERRLLTRTVRAAGTITPDESRMATITAKFGGFIEELFVPTTGAEVRSGQPLFRVWIEGPDILQKQADLLAGARGTGRAGDARQSEQNLRQFGISDQVIEQLRRSGETIRSIIMTAPIKGTVLEKPAIVGMRFVPGDPLFKVADLSMVWVIAQVAERDLALIRPGQNARVTVKAFAESPLEGRVTFIYPELDASTRTARARIELRNPNGLLKSGLYADVGIEAAVSDQPVLAIPDSAVIDSGTRRVAFVAKGDGRFEPRNLTLGQRANGYVEVQQGLTDGEQIVVTGNFLIDAESNLRSALAAFTPEPRQ